jgi:SAM-dependent methyltransferase
MGPKHVINWLHSVLHNPRRGWDPISVAYATEYGESLHADQLQVERFEGALGGFAGKRIVDLGSGPGQYAVEFARRGAEVTCIDVSATYLAMAEKRVREAGFKARFIPGYMDNLEKFTHNGFDAAFSNVTWCYCMNDLAFARRVYRAVKPGGLVYVQANIDSYEPTRSYQRRLLYWLNKTLCWKIGHPHPPRGRIAWAFSRLGAVEVAIDYRNPVIDLVLMRKPTQI